MAEGELLSGVRVIDWSVMQTASYGAQMLASLGAEVIHVEEREHGDVLRGIYRAIGIDCMLPGDRHVWFEEFNLNKRSLALDIKHPKGKEIMYQLVERSDVFLTNFRQDAVNRLGMSYSELEPRNPKLIYCSVTGFGRRGPDAHVPSNDLFAQARSGTMTAGEDEGDPPAIRLNNIGDRVVSITAAFGIMAALNGRYLHGVGQEIHVSQLGCLMCLQGANITPTLLLGQSPVRLDSNRPRSATYTCYKCKDGKWLAIGGTREKNWIGLCHAVERNELVSDPRFDTEAKRAESAGDLLDIMKPIFLERSVDEWMDICRKHDVSVSPVNHYADLASDPQVVENEYIVDWDHPTLGPIKFPGFPVEFTKTPCRIHAPAPEMGQHTEEVLVETLGYSWNEVEKLRNEGVI